MNAWFMRILVLPLAMAASSLLADGKPQPMTPEKVATLFNGKDLTGLSTWLKDAHHEDPRGVFKVTDGMIHLSGDGDGYVATKDVYRDYHLTVEYKWGKAHKGKYVRNSGVLLHAVGPDGNAGGAWPSCIECQLAQGCVGDLILIRGKNEKGEEIPVKATMETELAPDKRRHRWKEGGDKKTFPPARGQLWWSQHDWDFEEFLDTRGKHDVESPVGEWTKVECICQDASITIKVNGQTVNRVTEVYPTAGRILLQTEGSEIYFRKFEIGPVK